MLQVLGSCTLWRGEAWFAVAASYSSKYASPPPNARCTRIFPDAKAWAKLPGGVTVGDAEMLRVLLAVGLRVVLPVGEAGRLSDPVGEPLTLACAPGLRLDVALELEVGVLEPLGVLEGVPLGVAIGTVNTARQQRIWLEGSD